MAEKYHNDLMHLQNDILIDIKNVETNLDKKIKKLNIIIEQKISELEKKLNHLENDNTILLQRTQNIKPVDNMNERENILSKIDAINKKIEERYFNIENKCFNLRTDLKDSCFKYDKILDENFNIPGLIGFKAPFANFRIFIENLYKKLIETLKAKDFNVSEFKKYKEKLDRTINITKSDFSILESKIKADFRVIIKNLEKNYDDKFNNFEEKIKNIENENEKKSTDLSNQCNDLSDKLNQIDNSLKKTSDDFNEQIYYYKNEIKEENDKFENKFKSLEEKLKIINEQLVKNNNNNNANFTNLGIKIKELENLCLTMKNENNFNNFEIEKKQIKQLDYFENIELSKSNFFELNNEEDNKDSLFRKRLNKIFQNNNKNEDNNNSKNKDDNNNNSKLEQKIVSPKNNSKKTELDNSDEKDEKEKKDNILYNSGFLEKPKSFKGVLKSLNKNNKIKHSYKRIISGKIFNKFPFISYYKKGDNEDIQHSLSRNKLNSFNKEKIKSEDNSVKKIREEKYMDVLTSNSRYLKKNRTEKNLNMAKEKNTLLIYKYKYLEKKMDILGRAMIENFNKIIKYMKKQESKKSNDNNPLFKVIKLKDNNILDKNDNFRSLSRGNAYISPDLKKSDTFYQKEDSNSFIKSKLNQNFNFLKN